MSFTPNPFLSKSLLSADTLKIISEVFPQIKICVCEIWKDSALNNKEETRLEIRQSLLQEAQSNGIHLSPDEIDQFLDLKKPPHLTKFQASISHCPEAGGWIFSPQTSPPLGFDLEVSARVKTETVARISQPQETQSAPSPAHLWCAKEAAFKASPSLQLVSQVETSHWIPLKNNWWLFKAKTGEQTLGQGLCGPENSIHLAVYASSASLTDF